MPRVSFSRTFERCRESLFSGPDRLARGRPVSKRNEDPDAAALGSWTVRGSECHIRLGIRLRGAFPRRHDGARRSTMPNRPIENTNLLVVRAKRVLTTSVMALAASLLVAPVLAENPEPPKPAKKAAAKPSNAKKKVAKKGAAKDAKAPAPAAAAAPASSTRGGDATVPRPKAPVNLPTTKDPETGDSVLVISNDSLENIFGPPPADSGPAYFEYEPSAGDAKKPAAGKAAPKQDADARIAEIRQDLERLRGNRLRIRNPLLRRPEVTEEEAVEQQGMDNVQRLQATDARIAALEAELAELQAGARRGSRESSGGGS